MRRTTNDAGGPIGSTENAHGAPEADNPLVRGLPLFKLRDTAENVVDTGLLREIAL